MEERYVPELDGNLRKHMIRVPECINEATGISIFGKLMKSIAFTTDVAVSKNINANAIIAVYPFTPQPAITQAILSVADVPVFCGVGGGTTTGKRVVNIARDAEFQGAIGVVVNAPTSNETVEELKKQLDIPVVVTVVSKHTNLQSRIDAVSYTHLDVYKRQRIGRRQRAQRGPLRPAPGELHLLWGQSKFALWG